MKKMNFGKRKIIASLLCANMFLMNTPLGVLASTITGFDHTSGTYNIEALKHSGSTGFRNYTDFKLSQGDIANLIFKDGQQHFVNLVKNYGYNQYINYIPEAHSPYQPMYLRRNGQIQNVNMIIY